MIKTKKKKNTKRSEQFKREGGCVIKSNTMNTFYFFRKSIFILKKETQFMNAVWLKISYRLFFQRFLKMIFKIKTKINHLKNIQLHVLELKKVIFLVYSTHLYNGNIATILVYLRPEIRFKLLKFKQNVF